MTAASDGLRPHFVWPVRVYYEDTDAGGVVYYANYLRFMERARSEWLRALGFEQDRIAEQQRLLFVVRAANLEYRRPARFNDCLQVDSRVAHHTRASLNFEQVVRLAGGDGATLCDGIVRVVCVERSGWRPRPIPSDIIAELTVER
jgi:acyl-CoA thioester hydrolase